jgi:hypothetical protein
MESLTRTVVCFIPRRTEENRASAVLFIFFGKRGVGMSTISKIGKGRFIALALFFLLGGLPQRATAGLCASLIGDPFQATCENMP